jgi:hypothetical protein
MSNEIEAALFSNKLVNQETLHRGRMQHGRVLCDPSVPWMIDYNTVTAQPSGLLKSYQKAAGSELLFWNVPSVPKKRDTFEDIRKEIESLMTAYSASAYVAELRESTEAIDAAVNTAPTERLSSQLMNCVRSNPHESIKLFSKIGVAFFLFTMVVFVVTGTLIVNPFFSFFATLACLLFWTMAKVDERLYHKP